MDGLGPMFLGTSRNTWCWIRDRTTLLLAVRTGHLGPTVFCPTDLGRSWQEATRLPASATGDPSQRSLNAVFWLAQGHSQRARCFVRRRFAARGSSGTEDGGDTWDPVSGWNDHTLWETWAVARREHARRVDAPLGDDPRSAHLYIGLSAGGVFESVDGGADWQPLNAGCLCDVPPDPEPEFARPVSPLIRAAAGPSLPTEPLRYLP